MRLRTRIPLLAVVLAVTHAPAAVKEVRAGTAETSHSVLWTDPVDIRTRDLFFGVGGRSHAPKAPFTFVKEDLDGTNPKFEVRDARGDKWKVKMGIEAKPETVASRLVWAAGYHPEEEYFFELLEVREMPKRLRRGSEFITGPGVREVRLKKAPDGEKKSGEWKWRESEFTGTREWNGLRVLMALVNNWDLKNENTAVAKKGDLTVYRVSDLGATFGCSNLCWPKSQSRGDLGQYRASRFIARAHGDLVDFQTPGTPSLIYIFSPVAFFKRVHMRGLGRDIPRADARWMGEILSLLSQRQIQDAFRAAGYSTEEVDAFSSIVMQRIAALRGL